MKRSFTILLYICISLGQINAQEVKVTAAFDTSRILIGDQVNYTVTVDKPVNLILAIPQFRDSLLQKIEIINGPLSDTAILKNGRMRITQKYLVTSFDSGYYEVPPVYAELVTPTGLKRFYSDYTRLEVIRVNITPPDTTAKIFDIVKPYKAPVTVGDILPWLFVVVIAGAIVWYLLRLYRKIRMRNTGEEPVVPVEPAHVIAFRALGQLKDEKLYEKGEIKKYYTQLTEIVRQYLENRFNIFSLELTTIETLTELKKTGFKENESYGRLRTVLTGADLVKFAKYKPDLVENEAQFNNAWQFVDATKIEPVLTEELAVVDPNSEKA